MKTITLDGVEVLDNETSPILLAECKDKSLVWTHLHRDIDAISTRRFSSKEDARNYALSLAELLNHFITDVENLIQNYSDGEAVETSKTTIIDI